MLTHSHNPHKYMLLLLLGGREGGGNRAVLYASIHPSIHPSFPLLPSFLLSFSNVHTFKTCSPTIIASY